MSQDSSRTDGGGEGISYKAEHVPAVVAEEFRSVVLPTDMTYKERFRRLLAPEIEGGESDPVAWREDLRRRVYQGLLRVGEFEHDANSPETISVHLPPAYRAMVAEVAKSMGINVGAVGRLILIGLAGKIRSRLFPEA